MVALSPLKILHFPYNLELVDFWTVMALPILWLYFLQRRQTRISWSYVPAMLLILLGSFISTFVAISPARGLIVILKEVYVFMWFITLAVVIAKINISDLRKVMAVWSIAVVVHGLVIVGQFASADLWRFTASLAGKYAEYEHYRSPGLFTNANSASFFQLIGFVPLVLARFPRHITLILGGILFLSLLGTGSMGGLTALGVGTLVCILAIIVLKNRIVRISKHLITVVLIVAMFGGAVSFVISGNKEYKDHLKSILIGRADRSSGGRFDLWQRGVDVFIANNGFLFGVGPENFREVDGRDKQLHNDFLAFSVERGLFSVIGLLLFGVVAINRSYYLFKTYSSRLGLEVVVFLGIFAGSIVESLTHQIFHTREIWLVLAALEGLIAKMKLEGSSVRTIPDASGMAFWRSVMSKTGVPDSVRNETIGTD